MHYRDSVGVRWNDALSYELIGRRVRGSFRTALRRYGMEPAEIARVIADLDCGREARIQRGVHRIYFRPL